ncbi:MAG: transposase [Proteobacteria bacterium]|nr:transposase [Pseudomonadota bacterium]
MDRRARRRPGAPGGSWPPPGANNLSTRNIRGDIYPDTGGHRGGYEKWVNLNQQCLAHFIRKARALSESTNEQVCSFGDEMLALLQQLCHFAKEPPGKRKWNNFYTRFLQLLMLHDDLDNEAGKLARSLASVMDSLWVFLDEQGVDQTNNRAERALRFGVIWRKRCFGSQSEKGALWVERFLSLKETCRLKSKSSFDVLTDLVQAYFKEQKTNLA